MSRLTLSRSLQHGSIKAATFAVSLAPFGLLVWRAFANDLGPNPAEALIRSTGDWTLRFLCLTLAVTPVRHLTGWNQVLRFRRMLGLFAFFYATLHVVCYSGFDMSFEFVAIFRDIAKRPFILAGTLAFLLMLPLAATSFNRAIRMLGARAWQRLHRLVYAIAGIALVHFWWMRAGKNDFGEPMIYIVIVASLLMFRVIHRYRTVCSTRNRTSMKSGSSASSRGSVGPVAE